MTTTRLLTPDDAVTLARIAREDRDFFAPWEPARDERWSTEDGQRDEIGSVLEQHRLGLRLPHVVLDDTGDVVGRITLNNVVRGAFQSCSVGYWIRSAANGRGHATAAVREMVRTPGRSSSSGWPTRRPAPPLDDDQPRFGAGGFFLRQCGARPRSRARR